MRKIGAHVPKKQIIKQVASNKKQES